MPSAHSADWLPVSTLLYGWVSPQIPDHPGRALCRSSQAGPHSPAPTHSIFLVSFLFSWWQVSKIHLWRYFKCLFLPGGRVVESPQDHLQVLWLAKRTHRTPESCYILTFMIYYSEGHTLKSPMAMAHREESRRNQHEIPGALRQESYRTLPHRPLTCWVNSLRHFLNKKYVTVLV